MWLQRQRSKGSPRRASGFSASILISLSPSRACESVVASVKMSAHTHIHDYIHLYYTIFNIVYNKSGKEKLLYFAGHVRQREFFHILLDMSGKEY